MCCAWPGGKNCDKFVSCKPRDCSVSATEEASIVPVEFESSTEKDSRMLWRSCGGSLERLSFWLSMLFETRRRGSLPLLGVFEKIRDDVSYLAGDAGL